jgi:PKD repeat protein
VGPVIVAPTPTPAPVADFTATPQTGYDTLTVAFTDYSTESPTSWQWDFDNDGTIDSTLQNPTYQYTTPGTYSVKLIATNASGSGSVTKMDFIVVIPPTDFIGDQTTEPTSLGFGNNVFSTNDVTTEPTSLGFGNNVFSTDDVTPFPVTLALASNQYTRYGTFAASNGFGGDIGIIGHLSDIPPFSVSDGIDQTTPASGGTASNIVLTGSGINSGDGTFYVGAGNSANAQYQIKPLPIYQTRSFSGVPPSTENVLNFYIPMKTDDKIWIVYSDFSTFPDSSGYSYQYYFHIVVGPTASAGDYYIVSSPSISAQVQTTITRVPALPSTTPTIIFRSENADIQYSAAYDAAMETVSTSGPVNSGPVTGVYDQSNINSLATFPSATTVTFANSGISAVLGTVPAPYAASPYAYWEFYWESGIHKHSALLAVGMFVDQPSNHFDPNINFGNASTGSVFYIDDGRVFGIGSTVISPSSTFSIGDVIGITYAGFANIVFIFKNGMQIGYSYTAIGNGYPLISLNTN